MKELTKEQKLLILNEELKILNKLTPNSPSIAICITVDELLHKHKFVTFDERNNVTYDMLIRATIPELHKEILREFGITRTKGSVLEYPEELRIIKRIELIKRVIQQIEKH